MSRLVIGCVAGGALLVLGAILAGTNTLSVLTNRPPPPPLPERPDLPAWLGPGIPNPLNPPTNPATPRNAVFTNGFVQVLADGSRIQWGSTNPVPRAAVERLDQTHPFWRTNFPGRIAE